MHVVSERVPVGAHDLFIASPTLLKEVRKVLQLIERVNLLQQALGIDGGGTSYVKT